MQIKCITYKYFISIKKKETGHRQSASAATTKSAAAKTHYSNELMPSRTMLLLGPVEVDKLCHTHTHSLHRSSLANKNPTQSHTRHGQVRSISCLGHVLDSDSTRLRLGKSSHIHWGSNSNSSSVKRQKMRQIVRYWRHAPKSKAQLTSSRRRPHLRLSHVPPHMSGKEAWIWERESTVCITAFLSFNLLLSSCGVRYSRV